FIGYNNVSGDVRFTYGVEYLWDGVRLVPALIGLFAVAEMINLMVKGGTVARDAGTVKITRMMSGVMETFRHPATVLRGSIIGTVVGAIPGVGGVVASFLSYSLTVQASKDPDSFGKGNIKGVIAPEAAINAKDGSALIPTLAFGIPAGAADAGAAPDGDLRPRLGAHRLLYPGLLHRPVVRTAVGHGYASRLRDP